MTYVVVGRFQPASTTAQATAAGTWRENVKLSSGNRTSCTSGNVPWTATLNRVPTRPRNFVRAGSYTGTNGQNGNGFSFTVTPGGTSMQNITDTITGLSCIPSGSQSDKLTVQQIPIRPDGAFSSITHQTNVISGSNATITYTVAGYFEGQTTDSSSFVAGTWREDITFASGNTTSCSSDDVYWTASIT
jgi:hypothetical protein